MGLRACVSVCLLVVGGADWVIRFHRTTHGVKGGVVVVVVVVSAW